jgi:hypothetical protein
MAQDTPISAFVKWTAAIASAVLSSVLIWWLTKPTPPPPPPPASIVIEGRVISSQKLLPGIPVTLTAGAFSVQQSTDSEGRYGFSVSGVDPTVIANLKIEASGYTPNPYVVVEPLQQLSNSDGDQLLEAVASPSPPPPSPGGAGNGGAPGRPPATAVYVPPERHKPNFVLPAYVRRQDLVKLTPVNKQ